MSLAQSILGLLSYEPMTGYDMKRFMDNSLNFFWTAQASQIYRELSALEKKGLIAHQLETAEGRMDRKVYHITEKGREEFARWLHDFPETLTPSTRDEFSTKIFFGSQLPLEEIRFQISRYIREKEAELKAIDYVDYVIGKYSQRIHRPEEVFFWNLLSKRNRILAKSLITWGQECLTEIDQQIEANHRDP